MIAENDNAPVASEPQMPAQPPITELEWSFTKNMGNYQSQRLSVRMPVDPGANPEEVLAAAQQWVTDHLAPSSDELWAGRQELGQLQSEKFRLQSQVDGLNARYVALRAGLGKLGMNLPESVEELPF